MEIDILEFVKEEKGKKIGYVDFKVVYDDKKWEILRNLALFVDGEKKWLSLPRCKRAESWVPVYERSVPMNETLSQVVKKVEEKYLNV